MFSILFAAAAGGIAKHLFASWLGDNLVNTVAGELIGALAGRLGGLREAKQAERQIEAIRDAVIADLETFFVRETNDKAKVGRIAEALGATLNAVPTTALLVKGRFDARKVGKSFADAYPAARASLDSVDQGLYDRALEATAAALHAIAQRLPDFQTAVAEEQLTALDFLSANVGPILSHVRTIKDDVETIRDRPAEAAQSFEDIYRRTLRARVAELRLFGLPHHDNSGDELDLKIAYIPLSLTHASDGLSVSLDYPQMLAVLPILGNRLLIEGAAGSGKTTLMQWTALNALDHAESIDEPFPSAAAVLRELPRQVPVHRLPDDESGPKLPAFFRDLGFSIERGSGDAGGLQPGRGAFAVVQARAGDTAEDMPWWRRLPVLLRLRDCSDGRLPSPDDLPKVVAREVGNAPHAWLRMKLDAGHALLLIDGIDEVPEAARRRLHNDLNQYAIAYPKTLVIVTTRPAAVLEGYWERSFSHRLSVREMSRDDITAFISQWHDALAARNKTIKPIADVASLTRQVLESPALTQLAETPLLCAAICYVHRIKRGEIPRRAVRLYEAICEQLVHQLDVLSTAE